MFLIAWAVIERECDASWGWFMELLKRGLEIPNTPGWTGVQLVTKMDP
ncbi:hypothetical protein LINPERPRIM_LOCUS12980 [Linum perenne]